MENNQIYSSVDNTYILGSIFVVDIEENETSIRLNLKGEYSLKVGDGGLSLLTLNTDKTLFTWAYTVLRRYGTSRTGFTFEAGRKSQTGPGVLRFSSPSGKLITQIIKQSVNRIKGDNSAPNPEPSNIVSSPKLNSFQDEMSGDYTEYSSTTGRQKRPVPKPADPHKELSLEFPRQYVNHRLAAGPTLSHPVNIVTQVSSPRCSNNPVSPYGVTESKSGYSTVGNQTILVDSYSEFSGSGFQSPQQGFPNFNQSVPFPTDVMNPTNISSNPFYTPPPSIPQPYHSIRRPQVTESKDKTLTNEFPVSCVTASTFPTCVSPSLKTDSGEDSSDGEVNPTSRKISQTITSVKELSADLELTTIQESEDYINLKKTPLDRTLSEPIDTQVGQIIRTTTAPNYLNIAPKSEKNPTDDYYNITPNLIEERKRSKTETPQISDPELESNTELNFSITPGPVSFSRIDEMFKSEQSQPIDDDMVYGKVQYFPYSPQPQPTKEQFYINSPTQFKPAYENITEHKQLDHEYIDQPVTTISQTLPVSPTKKCIVSSNFQPSTIKLKTRPSQERPVSSQYSFLSEVLGNKPRKPQAYNTYKSQNSGYSD